MKKKAERLREGLPVVDARADVQVFVTEADIACATPRDPCACAIAQSVRRAAGEDWADAQILRTIAYVKTRDEKGEQVWQRFYLPDRTRRLIEEFDLTGKASPGGYRLAAPIGRKSLDSITEASRRKRSEGWQTSAPHRRKVRVRTGEQIDLRSTIRNGSGHVHHLVIEA